MVNCLIVNDVSIAVERKKIKNLHLAVYPPDGRVHVSAPDYLTDEDVRSFVVSRWDWVERQRKEIEEQERQTRREYVSGESYYLFGRRYRLRVQEVARAAHRLDIQGEWMLMTIQPGTTLENRELVMREFMRQQLKEELAVIVGRLMDAIGEHDVTWEVKQMRAQWGSCMQKKRHLLLNLELARVPRTCIEYVVMHELCHLSVQNHSKLFEALLTQRMPGWRARRKELNDFIAMPMDV